LHICEEYGGGGVELLGGSKGNTQIGYFGLALGAKHLLDLLPDISGMFKPVNMRENFRRNRLKKVSEDNLIPGYPSIII
jgi:hypothetical protein